MILKEKCGHSRVCYHCLTHLGTLYNCIFVAIVNNIQFIREDTKETIETALRMGVRVKMITGDQLAIAQETARRLGMGSEKIYLTNF